MSNDTPLRSAESVIPPPPPPPPAMREGWGPPRPLTRQEIVQHREAEAQRKADEHFDAMVAINEVEIAAKKEALRRVDAREAREANGTRVRRTAAQYALLPHPAVVIDQVLPASPALLGGPEAAGKSLLARDWGLSIATGASWRGHRVVEPRNVLYVMDEGMHDFDFRWGSQELWDLAKDSIYVIDAPVNLLSEEDTGMLIEEYDDLRPGLVIFDTIYGMGMPDDMGVKEVAPVIKAMKRISQKWGACTLAIGHSGHNSSERRFRGSSMWRQRTDVDWHMAEGLLTCERSKIADKHKLSARYNLEFPKVRYLDAMEVVSEEAQRMLLAAAALKENPGASTAAIAKQLRTKIPLSQRSIERIINKARTDADAAKKRN